MTTPASKKPNDRTGKGGSRRLSRELALRALYQWQLSGDDLAALRNCMEGQDDYAEANIAFFVELLAGVLKTVDELDAALAPLLDRRVDELSPIERGCLLIGAYELGYTLNVPYKVAINEAVNLAKSYGGTDGHKYVNGVLDKLAKLARQDEIEAARRA